MVTRNEVWALQPCLSCGAFISLRISRLRTDLLEHRAVMLRSCAPLRRYRRPRPGPTVSWLCPVAERISFAGASEELHINVLLDHEACLVQIIGASTVRGASSVSLGVRCCHHDMGLRLRSLFGDRPRRTPTLLSQRFSKLKLADSWYPVNFSVSPYTLSWYSWTVCSSTLVNMMDWLSFVSEPCGSLQHLDLVPRCDSHRNSCGACTSMRRLAGIGLSRAAGALCRPPKPFRNLLKFRSAL